MFFDEVTIQVRAGDGGNGCVSFRREKFVPFGGPNGGNGGGGGSVYLRVNPHLNSLVALARQRHYRAENGGAGQGKSQQGATGEDLYIDVPPGTVARDAESGAFLGDLTHPGETLLVAEGGRGGRGNEVFKSSTRQTPRFAERGQPGQARTLALELRLIADVGLVGKPNAGKSTLLSVVSAARPKIADYPFTTLSPMLGVVEVDGNTLVMADIPGLIEGAHEGAGLGIQFLRHVARTRLLVHLVDGASPDPVADYHAINHELEAHSPELAIKPQIVALTKMDLTDAPSGLQALRDAIGEEGGPVYGISAVTGQGVQDLLRAVRQRLGEMPEPEPAEELFVFRPLERESTDVTITQEGPGVYRLAGEEVERLAQMTDWSSYESAERFERILTARGISAKLELAGVDTGDTVLIGSYELEWQ